MFKKRKEKISKEEFNELISNEKFNEIIIAACSLVVNKKVSVSFRGEDSYTNGRHINVGIFDFIKNYSDKVISYCITASALHEAQHVVSTDFTTIEKIKELYKDQEIVWRIIHDIENSIEDGRIENIHKNKYRKNIKFIATMREVWWQEQDINKSKNELQEKNDKEEAQEITEFNKEENEGANEDFNGEIMIEKSELVRMLYDLIFWICSIATTKKAPKSFWEKYKDNEIAKSLEENFKNKIFECVKKGTSEDVLNLSIEIFEFLKSKFPEDFFDKLEVYKEVTPVLILRKDTTAGDESDFIEEDLNVIMDIEKLLDELLNKNKENTKHVENTDGKENYMIQNYKLHGNKCPYRYEINKLRSQIEQLLSLKFNDEIRHLKHGKIRTKDLWRTTLGCTDIMYKPERKFKKDIAMYLLIDASGSMGAHVRVNGESITNMKLANRTAAILEEAFCNYVNLEIAYFDGRHIVVREFNDNSDTSYVWEKQRQAGGGNCDYENLEIAIDKLQLQHEKQKFIFIISDGAPCGCRDGKSAEQLVREQVDRGNKLNIQTIAFALDRGREHYVDMYDNIVTCKSDDLQNKLINLLAKKLL